MPNPRCLADASGAANPHSGASTPYVAARRRGSDCRLSSAPAPHALGLLSAELAGVLGGTGRAQALWRGLRRGEALAAAADVLSAKARARLGAACDITWPRIVGRDVAGCGTRKLLLQLTDGRRVETVLIPQASRTTVCVSTQAGCARGCVFCVTAGLGLQRHLSAAEIVTQTVCAIGEAREAALPPVRNLVLMGMGEPLDNLAAVRRSLAICTAPHGLALTPRRITVSTVGPSPRAIRACHDLPAELAWSLHTADETLRRRLVPTSRHSLASLREAFVDVLDRRDALLFVEITLMAGVNDSPQDAALMADFLAPLAGRVRVNLLPFNPGRGGFAPSSAAATQRFATHLRQAGYRTLVRQPRGRTLAAACGQLAGTSRSVAGPEEALQNLGP